MSPASPWGTVGAVAPATSHSKDARKRTLQEIMDEALALRIYEDECLAISSSTASTDLSDVFSSLESKRTDRELLSGDSFADEAEDAIPTIKTTTIQKQTAPASGKQRYDRSIPVEGSEKGLNSIRESFRKWNKEERRGRVEKELFATQDAVLDERTVRLLQKLINRGDLDEIHGCVQSGKEANVYFAIGTDPDTFQKRHCAVKAFKTTLDAFSNRKDYITGDRRYDLAFQKKDRRRQMREWSEKEFRNLSRAIKSVRVPEVYAVKEHIVVMEFIGDATQGLSAPTLKEVAASMSQRQLLHAYADLMQATRKLFHEAKLVHSDLSEYNVLYNKQKCWLIDFGQAVDQTHPQFIEFLKRDLANIHQFFEKNGVVNAVEAAAEGEAGLLTLDEMLAWVTSSDREADEVLTPYVQLKTLIQQKC